MRVLNELKGFLFEGANEPTSLIIYSPKITPRLKYVCRFIFNQGMLCNFELTENENEFINSKLARINYSDKTFENAFNIKPNGLLESGVMREPISDRENKNFEPFSFVFFYIARIEEWMAGTFDEHERNYGIELDEPEVDQVIIELKNKITSLFPSVKFGSRTFKYVSTIDVDNVYAYKAKPITRTIGGLFKDIFALRLLNVGERINTIIAGAEDPFDAYKMQVELSRKYNVPLIYFFLYRNGTTYDRTIDPDHPEFIKLLQYLKDQKIEFGLHPSYNSSVDTSLLKNELALLSKNSGKEIICSRQHYLRMNIRNTPKDLYSAGIRYDFTMGLANWYGYRAGTTLPFYYYDLASETELELMAVPFALMDGEYYSLEEDKDADMNSTEKKFFQMAQKAKEVNGLFITVFHDRSFSDTIAPGWKDLYIKLHENLRN